jgi:hypothetical protein
VLVVLVSHGSSILECAYLIRFALIERLEPCNNQAAASRSRVDLHEDASCAPVILPDVESLGSTFPGDETYAFSVLATFSP